MTENGHGVQVVQVADDHSSYSLDVEALRAILMQDDIKDVPVVVVSLAGAYRGGKSFMLNFFLRYLTSPVSAQADGSWLGNNSETLEGFSWRGGSKRNTTGLLLWSKPIVTSLATGEKVAVLLMDTQGTFDNKSTVRDCSTIFALSTLISSVQIYNLPGGHIQEDDLQHLQLFTEYGKLINEREDGGKAFQVLEFLVRDWGNDFEYRYGSAGGKHYLDELLKIVPGQPKELSDLRRHIRASFETVSCFLMPHPGLKVRKRDFKGRINELDPEFLVGLQGLASSIFGPQKLKVKMINGRAVRARELFTYFISYMGIFNSKNIPTPISIMQATAEAGLLLAENTAREQYEAGMDAACGEKAPSVSTEELKAIHDREVNAARATFNSSKKMGSTADADRHLEELTESIEKRLEQYLAMNMNKTQKAVTEAKEAYENTILNISGGNTLCGHPIDLQTMHNEAVIAAIQLFDSKRKRNLGKDDERAAFIKGFEQRYRMLRLTNEQNNKMVVSDLRTGYWEYMQSKSSEEPPLSSSDFEDEHRRALARALDGFKEKRNRPDQYTEDVFKTSLIEKITSSFESMKLINQSNNKEAFQAAIIAYSKHMSDVKPGKNKCLHPIALDREHESAKCKALLAFRPRKTYSAGFDTTDEEEQTLLNILGQRYTEMKDINDSTNQSAVASALNEYISRMDNLCGFSGWWLLIIPWVVNLANRSKFHKESKQAALELFYSRREGRRYLENDIYLGNLLLLIEEEHKKYK